MEYNIIVTSSSVLLCILLFIRSIFFRLSVKNQEKALKELEQEITTIKENENREQAFQTSLKHAEISTELQKTHSSYCAKKSELRAPERYGYARTMFQSGMTVDKIAATLGMSGHEIKQLLKLANLRTSHN